jgi:hypothetical protein
MIGIQTGEVSVSPAELEFAATSAPTFVFAECLVSRPTD